MRRLQPLLLISLSLWDVGCVSDSPASDGGGMDAKPAGTEGAPCLPGNQCVAGLVCASGYCVNLDAGMMDAAKDGSLMDGGIGCEGSVPAQTNGTVSCFAGMNCQLAGDAGCHTAQPAPGCACGQRMDTWLECDENTDCPMSARCCLETGGKYQCLYDNGSNGFNSRCKPQCTNSEVQMCNNNTLCSSGVCQGVKLSLTCGSIDVGLCL